MAECVYRNQSKRAAASLKEDMEFLGPVRLMDVEKSQQKIVSVIRRLDDAGRNYNFKRWRSCNHRIIL